MTRACDLTGKKVQFGNNVSKANNKTKKKFIPNIQSITFKSDILSQNLKLNVAASTVRTVTKYGGIDEFLIRTKNKNLSPKAKKFQKVIRKISEKN